jgi:putative toxin-antitoxin system antitoxin component (TIGR02293 family)
MSDTEATPGLRDVARFWKHASQKPRPEHLYVALLGLRTYDTLAVHERVEEGLSYGSLERLRRVLGVPASRFAELISVPTRTLVRRKEAGRLQPDESDRLLRLSRIVGLALELFEGELEASRRWLLDRNLALGGPSPVELTSTDVGAREVENLIGRLEHGIPL